MGGILLAFVEILLLFSKWGEAGFGAEKSDVDFVFDGNLANIEEVISSISHDPGTRTSSDKPAGIKVTVSEKGLAYGRDVMVNEVLKELTPLKFPDINKQVSSFFGNIDITLSDLVLSEANVTDSKINLSETGITISVSGVSIKLSSHWAYMYTSYFTPFPIVDEGNATVKVKKGQAALTFKLDQRNGTLNLTVEEAGSQLGGLLIELEGGGSWLYQWFIYLFQDWIQSTVEGALTTQILGGAEKLDLFLENFPRQLPVDAMAAIDVTIVGDPIVNPSYITVGVRGEFVTIDSAKQKYGILWKQMSNDPICNESQKMVTIALRDSVLNSASAVYYNAGSLHWLVDKLPEQSLLNTASWKLLIPQLYKKYPNEDMVLNISASEVPLISLTHDGVIVTAAADMTLEVLDNLQTTPVACISMKATMKGTAGINGNNITGQADLYDLTLGLKWSDVGNFHVKLIQTVVRTVLRDVILPFLNIKFRKGFPLPMIPAVDLQNSYVQYEDEFLLVCSDLQYTGILPNISTSGLGKVIL